MHRIRTIGVVAAVLALGLGTAWALGGGTLDPSFGTAGVVNGGAITYWDAVALSDGSVLTVGELQDGTERSFVLQKRLAVSGALDPNFGPNGDGTAPIEFGDPRYGARLDDLAVAPDGKIFVAGYSWLQIVVPDRGKKTKTETVTTGSLAAFSSTGILDTEFGSGGYFENDGSRIKAVVPVGTASAYDLVLGYEETVRITTPATGKGKKNQATWTDSRATVLHMIDSSGATVAAFGEDGRVVEDLSPVHEDLLNSIAVDSQGRIAVVLVQYLKTADGAYPLTDVLLSRYDSGGTIDPEFGTAGRVSILDLDQVKDIAIDGNDAIVVAAHHNVSEVLNVLHNVPEVVRYDVNGDFDVAFDVPEMPDASNPLELDTWATDVEVDSQGRVVVSLWYGLTNYDFTAVRCLANGDRDTSFGANGIATPLDVYDRDAPVCLALDGSDRIVMAGQATSTNTANAGYGVLVRWLAD